MNGLRQQLETYRDLLELREHDVDRLLAEHEGILRLVLSMIERGHVAAAKAIIRRNLAEDDS
ncbi:hypothetical protein NKI48_02645 [Mesorhizobium sp. M0644]|uniref:hypothetical protein n=1 Tax=Mesorhizobium sp. M0644 TaxID=2956979 RepID=UPI00333CA609